MNVEKFIGIRDLTEPRRLVVYRRFEKRFH